MRYLLSLQYSFTIHSGRHSIIDKKRFTMIPTKHVRPRFCVNRFSPDQVKTMLTLKDSMGRSLLALAATSGDKVTFESVLTTIQEKLTPEQVK